MRKIRLEVRLENYVEKVPLKIKHDIHDMFGGFEDLFGEAIHILQTSITQEEFNLKKTNQVLWNHAYVTTSAILEGEDVSEVYIHNVANALNHLCFDLHDAVIPHVAVRGYDISDVVVRVDRVDTPGKHNGDVGYETTLYITYYWGDDDEEDGDSVNTLKQTVQSIWNKGGIHNQSNGVMLKDTCFEIDDENLYYWAPNKLHTFVRGFMVDILVCFLKYGMKHPANLIKPSNVSIDHVVWDSIRKQIGILEEEVDTMTDHSYNQEVLEIYYCYDDHLKNDEPEMNSLIKGISRYVTNFFYSPSELRHKVWSRLSEFKNVLVFRNKNTVMFRLLPI